jgi:hypothetical protein
MAQLAVLGDGGEDRILGWRASAIAARGSRASSSVGSTPMS